jgi:hypothetical protein
MLKMGVEYLACIGDFDIFDSQFNLARKNARAPHINAEWLIAYSILKPEETIVSIRDEGNELFIEETVYNIRLATEPACDGVALFFSYGFFGFIAPLNNQLYNSFYSSINLHNIENPSSNPYSICKVAVAKLE